MIFDFNSLPEALDGPFLIFGLNADALTVRMLLKRICMKLFTFLSKRHGANRPNDDIHGTKGVFSARDSVPFSFALDQGSSI